MSEVNLNLTLPIYYDIEAFKSYSDDEGNIVSPPDSIEEYEKIILSFIDEMNQLGYEGMVQVYSYQWYCENRLDSEAIRPYLSWYANYSSSTMTYDNSSYVPSLGWQYTSSGKINGITTKVDISCFPDYILEKSLEVRKIILNGKDILVPTGEMYQIEARIFPSSCTANLTYSSSDEEVAEVENGIIYGKKCGTAIITVTTSNGIEASMEVTVYQPVTAIQVESEITIPDQGSYQLNVSVLPEDATNQEVTCLNLNPEIMQIEEGMIIPLAVGDGRIMVSVDSQSTIINVHIIHYFEDVDPAKWYYTYINEAYKRKLMTGLNETDFGPYESLNRGMLVTILYRMAGNPEIDDLNSFTDIDPDKYYAKAVAWAKNNSIVQGYSDGTFKPYQAITRQELSVMLCNYARYCGIYQAANVSILDDYPDCNNVSSWAKEAMAWAVENKIITGDLGYLNPKFTASRAQSAKVIVLTNNLMN